MSFILNALRKSEQERLSNHAETLEGKILLKQEGGQKDKTGWLVILILILINLLLIAFFFWHFTRQEEKARVVLPVAVVEKFKKPLQVKQEISVMAVKQGKTQAQISAEKIVQVQGARLKIVPQATISEQINHQKQNEKEKSPSPVSLTAEQITKPVKVKRTSAIVVKKNSVEPEVAPPNPSLVVSNKANDPPYLSDMAYEFQLSVPDIKTNVFVYTAHPEDRFIMVKMRKYQAGQKISEEMQLQEIRPNSIVVQYQGKVFQIRQ